MSESHVKAVLQLKVKLCRAECGSDYFASMNECPLESQFAAC